MQPTISFPGLGIGELNPNPVIEIGTFRIYWYGVIIACGVLLALLYCSKRIKQFGHDTDTLTSALLVGLPSGIIGARLYYVLFNWAIFKDNPISALYIWEGGLAIYGGVIGGVIGLLIYTKCAKKKLTPLLDVVGLGLLIGQTAGRWGNFMNREAYGSQIFDDFFLRMGLTTNGVTTYWHPTFLYESVWNLVGFALLHFMSKKRRYDGQVFLWYVAWYGLGRLWIEGLRTDSLYLFGTGIRVSQLLAGLSCLAAVMILLYLRFIKLPNPSRMLVNTAVMQTAAVTVDKNEAADSTTAPETNEAENTPDESAEAENMSDETTEAENIPKDTEEKNNL